MKTNQKKSKMLQNMCLKILNFFIFFGQLFAQMRIQLFVLTDFFVHFGVSSFHFTLNTTFTVLSTSPGNNCDIFVSHTIYEELKHVAGGANMTVD